MDHNPQNSSETLPLASADYGNVPHPSEPFSTVQNGAEGFRKIPKIEERKESHTLTVREVARMFETAGVPRTERSIVNWCQPNRTGIARLDSYFDPNERRYFISPQSVEQAIAEEKAKVAKNNSSPEPAENIPHVAETVTKPKPPVREDESRIKELEHENLDLRITNRSKDMYIEQLKIEQNNFVGQLLTATHKVGVLETKILQIESPARSLIEAPQIGIASES